MAAKLSTIHRIRRISSPQRLEVEQDQVVGSARERGEEACPFSDLESESLVKGDRAIASARPENQGAAGLEPTKRLGHNSATHTLALPGGINRHELELDRRLGR
jgi:hypothetical protein